MALRLVERGYWQQALGVIRMAMEDMLVTEDIEGNPAALNALFSKEGRFGRGETDLPEDGRTYFKENRECLGY